MIDTRLVEITNFYIIIDFVALFFFLLCQMENTGLRRILDLRGRFFLSHDVIMLYTVQCIYLQRLNERKKKGWPGLARFSYSLRKANTPFTSGNDFR